MAPSLVVATHGHCFDGMTSAALFTRLLEQIDPGALASVRYRSCGYGPGMAMIPEAWLEGSTNAILDFRYTPSSRLTWYFDHHVTGFGSDDERDAATALERVHYDAAYSSCSKLIADVASKTYGVDIAQDELVRWADIIDAARFPSAEAAIDRTNPALRIASVVEHHGDEAFLAKFVPKLRERGLELADDPEIQALFAPIALAQDGYASRVARASERVGRVVLVDLSDAPLDVAGKFVAYAQNPDAVYSVMLSRSKHFKLSVGYNPWCGVARDRDISVICKRYGGGGHPVVGGATFTLDRVDEAREIARAVARELAG